MELLVLIIAIAIVMVWLRASKLLDTTSKVAQVHLLNTLEETDVDKATKVSTKLDSL